MFRILTVVVLLSALFTGTGIRTFITVRFHFQQEEIAKTSCENKAKPELKCNGKCQLAKQLKEAESNTENPAQPVAPGAFAFPELNMVENNNSTVFFGGALLQTIPVFYPDRKIIEGLVPLTPPPPEC
jgi:hypothetical protein